MGGWEGRRVGGWEGGGREGRRVGGREGDSTIDDHTPLTYFKNRTRKRREEKRLVRSQTNQLAAYQPISHNPEGN